MRRLTCDHERWCLPVLMLVHLEEAQRMAESGRRSAVEEVDAFPPGQEKQQRECKARAGSPHRGGNAST